MPEDDKVVKVPNALYEKAKQLAEAKGLNIGDVIVEAGQELAPSVSICEEAGFKEELRKLGITPPTETKWLFGFLDNFTVDMLKGSKLLPYAEAKAKSKAICSLLPGAEEAIESLELASNESATEEVAEPEPSLPETSFEKPEVEAGAKVEAPTSTQGEAEPAEVAEKEESHV